MPDCVSVNLRSLWLAFLNRDFLLRSRFGIRIRPGELEGSRHVPFNWKIMVPGFFLGMESRGVIRGRPNMENDLRFGPRSRRFARLDLRSARRRLGAQRACKREEHRASRPADHAELEPGVFHTPQRQPREEVRYLTLSSSETEKCVDPSGKKGLSPGRCDLQNRAPT